MAVAYRMWSARTARLLSDWSTWFPDELVGGRAKAPPAVDTGNEVAARLAIAHADHLPLAGACLDTIKCFDSVSLHSLRVLLKFVGAPGFMYRVLDLWASLKRHVWTIDGPTGVCIRADDQKGLPQGDPLAPWALNLVMATWLWSLPHLDLTRVFLDDRCMLHSDASRLTRALAVTAAFDSAFGMRVHPTKSCRFYVGESQDDLTGEWSALPLKVVIKYLGVQLETDPGASFAQGDSRMLAVKAKALRARLLPVAAVRRGLLASYLQGLYAEGVGATKRVTEQLTTAVVQAWWGPTLHPNNHMRSNAITLGLLCPLHRFAPSIVQCWSVLVALGRLLARFHSLGRDLWRIHDDARRGLIGFGRLIGRTLNLLSWSWVAWDVIHTHEGTPMSLPALAQRNNVGNQARHVLRASFRSWWWLHWDGSRTCLQGVGVGIDRERSLQPLHELKCRRLTFGWDGTDLGARYCRFLADALWSRHRLVSAGKVDDPRCRRCGLDDEHTDHFLWGCPANLEFRNRLNDEWRAAAREGSPPFQALPGCLPPSFRQCGVVPVGCSLSDSQIHAVQRYLVAILRIWALDRDTILAEETEPPVFQAAVE